MVILPTLIMGGKTVKKNYTPAQIDNAWIRVPWSHGGYYYHNTLTREDRDYPPNCLSNNCKWNWL